MPCCAMVSTQAGPTHEPSTAAGAARYRSSKYVMAPPAHNKPLRVTLTDPDRVDDPLRDETGHAVVDQIR